MLVVIRTSSGLSAQNTPFMLNMLHYSFKKSCPTASFVPKMSEGIVQEARRAHPETGPAQYCQSAEGLLHKGENEDGPEILCVCF